MSNYEFYEVVSHSGDIVVCGETWGYDAMIRHLDSDGYFIEGFSMVLVEDLKPLDAVQKQKMNGWMSIRRYNEQFDLNEEYWVGE